MIIKKINSVFYNSVFFKPLKNLCCGHLTMKNILKGLNTLFLWFWKEKLVSERSAWKTENN